MPSANVPAVVPILRAATAPMPRFVRAAAALVAPVPPLATATVPETLVAVPVRLAVIVPAEKLPNPSRDTTSFAVLPDVPKLLHDGGAAPFVLRTCPGVPAESI